MFQLQMQVAGLVLNIFWVLFALADVNEEEYVELNSVFNIVHR
jgi:hypothetical protein